jgi:hypothetical protein
VNIYILLLRLMKGGNLLGTKAAKNRGRRSPIWSLENTPQSDFLSSSGENRTSAAARAVSTTGASVSSSSDASCGLFASLRDDDDDIFNLPKEDKQVKKSEAAAKKPNNAAKKVVRGTVFRDREFSDATLNHGKKERGRISSLSNVGSVNHEDSEYFSAKDENGSGREERRDSEVINAVAGRVSLWDDSPRVPEMSGLHLVTSTPLLCGGADKKNGNHRSEMATVDKNRLDELKEMLLEAEEKEDEVGVVNVKKGKKCVRIGKEVHVAESPKPNFSVDDDDVFERDENDDILGDSVIVPKGGKKWRRTMFAQNFLKAAAAGGGSRRTMVRLICSLCCPITIVLNGFYCFIT